MVFWQNHVEVSKTSTQQCLAARVAKHIAIQMSLGDAMIPTDPVKYMDTYMLFLAHEVMDYLWKKKLQESQALSAMPSPYLGEAYIPQLFPANKALTLLQALQQPGETPHDYTARQAAVDHQQWATLGIIRAPDLASTDAGLVVIVEQPMVWHRLSGSTWRALTWEHQIALQQFCNGDMENFGQSYMDDKGVVLQKNTAYDVWLKEYVPPEQTRLIKKEEQDSCSPLRNDHARTEQSPMESQSYAGQGAKAPLNWSEERIVGRGELG
ncbi:hypothetical protein C0989_006576 [Termitomyces sp. Mn162]|nr:hypothetical protein C0989_006576 [Termitomyces sp. Mn162]